jgi:hypothetical protein
MKKPGFLSRIFGRKKGVPPPAGKPAAPSAARSFGRSSPPEPCPVTDLMSPLHPLSPFNPVYNDTPAKEPASRRWESSPSDCGSSYSSSDSSGSSSSYDSGSCSSSSSDY